MSTNIVYIKEVFGNVCGPHNTRLLYYRNTHPTLTIKITVDHWWVYNGEVLREPKKNYVLRPNPNADMNVVHEWDAYMGCPIPDSTMQRFHWDVVDAVPA
ncbi:hypothetical protein [Cupriavidus sp. RAF12]|uniref:hypothetical protein n=1 Tax=Cupriavidus sp. RAF12 TaxID=3233050 RepID=UPI003F8F1C2A